MVRVVAILLLAMMWSVGVDAQTPQTSASASSQSAQRFPMISIPQTITDTAERAKYLGEHYWDNVDFAMITPLALEEGVVEFITLFPLYDAATLKQMWGVAVQRAESAKGGLQKLLAICDKYLYGTSSPMYNEDAYRALLHVALLSDALTKEEKMPYQAQLVMAEMNNVGSPVVDFEITVRGGEKSKLSEVHSTVTILYFYNPGCPDCYIERSRLSQARTISYLVRAGGVKIVAVMPSADKAEWEKHSAQIPAEWINGYDATGKIKSEGLYDLRRMPRLYLLDDKKEVLLKNTSAAEIEEFLSAIMQRKAE